MADTVCLGSAPCSVLGEFFALSPGRGRAFHEQAQEWDGARSLDTQSDLDLGLVTQEQGRRECLPSSAAAGHKDQRGSGSGAGAQCQAEQWLYWCSQAQQHQQPQDRWGWLWGWLGSGGPLFAQCQAALRLWASQPDARPLLQRGFDWLVLELPECSWHNFGWKKRLKLLGTHNGHRKTSIMPHWIISF